MYISYLLKVTNILLAKPDVILKIKYMLECLSHLILSVFFKKNH